MSPQPTPPTTQKRSIKDHFTVIPPKPKKEEEPTVKIHPLFIKKPKAVVEEVKKENIAPPPTPPPSTTTLPKKKESPPIPIKVPKTTQNISKPKKRVLKLGPNPFDDIIKANTQQFFLSQKNSRAATTPNTLQPLELDHATLDIDSIEKLMNKYYTTSWKKQPCCQYLFNNLKHNNTTWNNKLLWCDKYRPDKVDGLLGYLPDYEYLRNWLESVKISGSSKSSNKKKKQKDQELEDPFNLILFVGDHGTGKTAAAYTAAKETGYTIFEINSTSRRAGKDVLNQVGEMTASHLVRFDHQQRKRKNKGEMIVLRDTVKKKKKIDIAMHFKKMVTVSEEQVVVSPPKEEEEDEVMKEVVEEEEPEVPPARNTIESFFKRSAVVKTRTANTIEKSATITKTSSTKVASTATSATPKTITTEPAASTTIEEDNDEEEEIAVMVEDQPKQSLVLLEEVDILFEEDKGFWAAVIELCQKSKRPIIMTCNDESQIPFDHLDIQSTIYFDIPDKEALLPYLHLVCFSENHHRVQPYDIEFLSKLYNHDSRKLIDTLQLWLNQENIDYLFAQIMGFKDLLYNKAGLTKLMDRLKGLSEKTIELCLNYYFTTIKEEEEQQVMGIEHVFQMMDTASFADSWIGLTDKQRHQIYDIDQYNNDQDILQKQNNTTILHYKNSTDLDHWELGEIIEKSILVVNFRFAGNWCNHLSAWSSHWETLCNTSKDSLTECSKIISQLSLLSLPLNNACLMQEYMPNIRSLCEYDQGIAGKGRTQRSRKKIRYIKLDDESRDYLINCGGQTAV